MTKIDKKNEPEKLIEDTSVPYRNEQAKRRFFEHLSGGEGFANDSVSTFAESIGQWQQFSKNDDFINFDKSKAMEFVAWQKSRPTKTKSGAIRLLPSITIYAALRDSLRGLQSRKSIRKSERLM